MHIDIPVVFGSSVTMNTALKEDIGQFIGVSIDRRMNGMIVLHL